MTTAELRACEPAYRAAVPGPVTGEARTQLHMVRTIVLHRMASEHHAAVAADQRHDAWCAGPYAHTR
jgi:hypothetical protein